MECPRKHKPRGGSNFIEEVGFSHRMAEMAKKWSGVTGQTIGNPLIAGELQGVSNLWCRIGVGFPAPIGKRASE